MKPARGFTLVEVMVALAIVAIALPALLTALYQQADDTAYLRDKSMAHLVAVNKLHQLRLVVANARQLRPLKDAGEAQLAERDWYWWVEVANAPGGVPDFYRVEISVAANPERQDQPLYQLVAFMSGDLREEQSAPPDNGAPADDPPPADIDPTPPGGPGESA